MKLRNFVKNSEAGSALMVYLAIAVGVMMALAAVASLVVSNTQFSGRRQSLVNAYQYAQGGAAICVREVESALTNTGNLFINNLTTFTNSYTKNDNLSTAV